MWLFSFGMFEIILVPMCVLTLTQKTFFGVCEKSRVPSMGSMSCVYMCVFMVSFLYGSRSFSSVLAVKQTGCVLMTVPYVFQIQRGG